MFTQKDFDIFQIEGLEARMIAIRENIQPIFQELDTYFVQELALVLGEVLPIHIAQHRRRTTYAPESTWSAMGGTKRGYKRYPHFQLGINGDFIFMWLSFIDQPDHEQEMAQSFMEHSSVFQPLIEKQFVLNTDHTKNQYDLASMETIQSALVRWHDVKKGEFQIGRVIPKGDDVLLDSQKALLYMLDTYQLLVPLYQLALRQGNV